jgi:hypothetical protein
MKESENTIKKYKTAYILYTIERRPIIKQQHPYLRNSRDITKIIADEWNSLPEEVKQKYREREKDEREIFERSKRNGDIKYRYKTFKRLKKPIRFRTPYMLFVRDNKANFKSSGTVETMANLSRIWRNMSDEEKKPYIVLSDDDKKRYLQEQNLYIKTFLHLKPSKLNNRPDDQLIELFKKSKTQEKQNYDLNDGIKKVLKKRQNNFNFEIKKEARPLYDVDEINQLASSDIELDFRGEYSESNIFGNNVKYGSEALHEFKKLSKQDGLSSYSPSSEEFSE